MSEIDEKDEFWSLDSMLPPKKSEALPKRSLDVTATEIELDGAAADNAPKNQRLDFSSWLANREKYRPEKKEAITVYEPRNPLIKSVTVRQELGRQSSVERFIINARELFDAEGEFIENVPFSSVFPQYALMTEEQKGCYIGFRSEVRKGRYPAVDNAYIYLYLYELINLSEPLSAKERAEQIAKLMCGYPKCDDKLFADMCTWLADVCLISGLEMPSEIYGDIHPRILKKARIKELFVRYNEGAEKREIYRLMTASGRYDYRTSHYYKEFSQYYDKHIENAVCYALAELSKRDSRFAPDEDHMLRITHESFFGAYRTVGARYTITIECASLTRTDEERRVVTELIKYAENRLRSALGIKQRLTVSYLTGEKKDMIKEYFADNASSLRGAVKKQTVAPVAPQIPEYEKLYEPKSEGFVLKNAEEIEENSWQITEKLVTAFDEALYGEEAEGVADLDGEKTDSSAPVTDKTPTVIRGLRAVYDGDMAVFNEIARLVGMLPAALADLVNEYLLDEIGDVGIEADGDGFKIVNWYLDDIKEILGV